MKAIWLIRLTVLGVVLLVCASVIIALHAWMVNPASCWNTGKVCLG